MIKSLTLIILIITGSHCQDDLVDYYLKLIDNYTEIADHYEYPKYNEDIGELKDNQTREYGIFDFIVIGGGTAGSVIANRLSEVPDWNILLLEAGGEPDEFSYIPGPCIYLTATELNWGYLTTPQTTCCKGVLNNQCSYPRGKTLGGSSVTNGIVYSRGVKQDYDDWEAMGNKGWNYSAVLPYFRKSENCSIYSDEYHGTNGTLHVEFVNPPHELHDTLTAALLEMGKESIDYNGAKQLGFSRLQLNTKQGRRVSAYDAFIIPAMHRPNLNISKYSHVTEILTTKTTDQVFAYGVEFIKNGRKYRAYAAKEVILSAGATNSPQILKLSGIGPKEELEKFNISLVMDMPQVGNNLQDHLFVYGTTFTLNTTLSCPDKETLVREFIQGRGKLTASAGMYDVWFDELKDNKTGVPDIEYIFNPKACFNRFPAKVILPNENLKAFLTGLHNRTYITFFTVLLHPKSFGTVTLASRKPEDFPNIDIQYYSDPEEEDLNHMYKAAQNLLKLMNTEPFRKLGAAHYPHTKGCEMYKLHSRQYWYCLFRMTSATLFHPMGTTRMGQSSRDSVVDYLLRVHGIGNLRIADAGIMPATLSGHTAAAAFMIGERLADFMKDHYQK